MVFATITCNKVQMQINQFQNKITGIFSAFQVRKQLRNSKHSKVRIDNRAAKALQSSFFNQVRNTNKFNFLHLQFVKHQLKPLWKPVTNESLPFSPQFQSCATKQFKIHFLETFSTLKQAFILNKL